jgi:hypothetical protein
VARYGAAVLQAAGHPGAEQTRSEDCGHEREGSARGTVTLTGPQGRSKTLKAHRPADLEKIRVGDLVGITYSEAL